MGNKEEFKELYKNTMEEFKNNIAYLENIDKIIDVSQEPIGRTPRSNPATYTGVFDHIRDLFTATNEARARGYQKGRFSFNVRGGRCEKCQGDMVLKTGPYGKYIECVNCKNRKKFVRSTGVKCPKCGEGDIIEKKSKSGKIFFGCNRYPDCSFALWDEPTGNKCPECGELLLKKVTKNGDFEVCSSRTCSYKVQMNKPESADSTETPLE